MNYDIFTKSVKDFLSGKFLTLSFAPLVGAAMVLSILMFLGVSEIYDILKISMQNGDYSFIDKEAHPLIVKVLSFAIVHYIIGALLWILGGFFVVVFSVVVAVLILGFLTPTVVKTLHARHYSHLPLPKDILPFTKSIFVMLFILIKFVLLFIICIPFMFIPILNVVIFNAPFYYLFHKLIVFDVASNIFSQNSYKTKIDSQRLNLMAITFCFYILALIPILGLFLQLFFAIYLSHYMFSKMLMIPISDFDKK